MEIEFTEHPGGKGKKFPMDFKGKEVVALDGNTASLSDFESAIMNANPNLVVFIEDFDIFEKRHHGNYFNSCLDGKSN